MSWTEHVDGNGWNWVTFAAVLLTFYVATYWSPSVGSTNATNKLISVIIAL